jgi:hypothetical protein
MHDPEFGTLPSQHASGGRCRKIAAACAILAVAGLLLPSSGGPRRYTCAACRLDRIDRGFLGYRWTEFEESECSRWYAAHVERSHHHVWASRGYCRRFGIPFLNRGYACNVGDPIAMLGPSFQLRIYQRFRDPLTAKGLFVRLGKADRGTSDLMGGLCEWMDTVDGEPWDEWWPRHQAEAGNESNDR